MECSLKLNTIDWLLASTHTEMVGTHRLAGTHTDDWLTEQRLTGTHTSDWLAGTEF